MTVIGRNRLKWEGNDLFFQSEKVMSIFLGDRESDLWWLRWPDGTVSVDYYNKTRAKEHATRMALKELNNGVEESEQDV